MKRQVQMRITRGRGGSGLRAEVAASIQNQLFSSIQNQYFLLFSSSTMLRHLTVGPSLLTSCGASIGLVMRWQQSWREECVCNDEPLHSPRAAQQRGSKPVRVLGAGRQRQCVSHRSLLAELLWKADSVQKLKDRRLRRRLWDQATSLNKKTRFQ